MTTKKILDAQKKLKALKKEILQSVFGALAIAAGIYILTIILFLYGVT